MIRKVLLCIVTVYIMLVMGSLFLFDRDQEEFQWRKHGKIELRHSVFTDSEQWVVYNVAKGTEWESTSNDPILLGPLMTSIEAKSTEIYVELTSKSKHIQVFWRAKNEAFIEARSKLFSSSAQIELVVDQDVEQVRIDPADQLGVKFTIQKLEIRKYE